MLVLCNVVETLVAFLAKGVGVSYDVNSGSLPILVLYKDPCILCSYFIVCSTGGHQASVSEVTDTVHAAYELALKRPKFCHLSVALCPLPIPLPFPKIFGNFVGRHGELLSSSIPGSLSRGSLDVHSIPMAARLRSSSAVLPFLETRLGNLRRFGIQQGAAGTELVRSWGFAKDELEDMEETLFKMVTSLDQRSQGSSDSD